MRNKLQMKFQRISKKKSTCPQLGSGAGGEAPSALLVYTNFGFLPPVKTNRKVAGSIPAGVNGIFHWHKILPIALSPWGRLSLEQKWVPGIFPGCKGGRCVRLTYYHHPGPLSRNLEALTSWNPLGHSSPIMGLIYLYHYASIYDVWNFSRTFIRSLSSANIDLSFWIWKI